MTLIQLFTNIANAIRAKTGSSETIRPTDFANQIDRIPTGIIPTGEIDITENGEYDVTNYTEANVNVVSEYNANVKSLDDPDRTYLYQYIDKIQDGIEVKKKSLTYLFFNFYGLITAPEMNTANVINMNSMFYQCFALVNVPIYNISSATMLDGMFAGCISLSNESLNNILAMLANATAYINQGTNMTLKYIGLRSSQATTCTTLSNWQACVDAGWTTGY